MSQPVQHLLDTSCNRALRHARPADHHDRQSEIARRLDVSPSSASRLLGTLAGHGLVEKVEATGRYRLGVRLLQLGTHVLQRLDVRAVARPILERHGVTWLRAAFTA